MNTWCADMRETILLLSTTVVISQNSTNFEAKVVIERQRKCRNAAIPQDAPGKRTRLGREADGALATQGLQGKVSTRAADGTAAHSSYSLAEPPLYRATLDD